MFVEHILDGASYAQIETVADSFGCRQRLLVHSQLPDSNNHTETILITTLFGQ